jgi:hypothetical protein
MGTFELRWESYLAGDYHDARVSFASESRGANQLIGRRNGFPSPRITPRVYRQTPMVSPGVSYRLSGASSAHDATAEMSLSRKQPHYPPCAITFFSFREHYQFIARPSVTDASFGRVFHMSLN